MHGRGAWLFAALTILSAQGFPPKAAAANRPGPIRGSVQSAPSDSIPGLVATCTDFRSLSTFGVHAQRILGDGSIPTAWSPDGARLCLGSTQNVATSMLPDGDGGAFVVWVDGRSGGADLYIQRLSGSGSVAGGWPQEGIALCVARGGQAQVSMCTDGADGAIVAWQDYRNDIAGDIYAQRVSDSGELLWGGDGVPVCADSTDDAFPALASSGDGGAVLVWEDHGSGYPALHVRRIGSDGAPTSATPLFATLPGTQRNPTFATGASSGGVLLWDESVNGSVSLRATRLDGSGSVVGGWPSGGVMLAAGNINDISRSAISDSAGGAVITWSARGDTTGDIRAQHVAHDGALLWTEGGVAVCTEGHEQFAPAIASDWAGGAIIAWEDHRSGRADLYAQRILAGGAAAWDTNGVALCRMPGDQYGVSLAPDGTGGALATWSDASRSARATFLRSQPVFTGAVPRLHSSETGPGRARLTYRTIEGDTRSLSLERRLPNEEWAILRSVRADADGMIVAEDRTVAPGAHVSYRLSLPQTDGNSIHFDEVALDIPEAVALALRYAANLDGGRALRVSLVLATNSNAQLEVMDVQGRRVQTQEIGALGAGAHEVDLPFSGRSPGLYFVRLHQGRETRSAKVMVIR